MYRQQQDMNPKKYSVFPEHQLFKDADYYLPHDDENEEDINTSDDIFVQPLERVYSDCNEKVGNTQYFTNTNMTDITTDEDYTSLFAVKDSTFLQMEPFPNISSDSLDNLNGNLFGRHDDDFDYDDFSALF